LKIADDFAGGRGRGTFFIKPKTKATVEHNEGNLVFNRSASLKDTWAK
jgi:hypothetical protein